MTIRLTWKRVILTLLAMAALGMAYAWSGAFNVAASSGHWKVTDWFLHWVMRNSVRTRAALTAPADPLDPTGLVSAAGHYANACALCHGAPGQRPSPVMLKATPHAPSLIETAPEWSDRQIFWILRHGVKYTGMPAWAAGGERPDEIRRMVAFVRLLPTMGERRYRALIGEAGDAGADGDAAFAGCARCHGADGRGRGQPDIPVLGGQRPEYLLGALEAYAKGTRHSAVMETAVTGLSADQLRGLALRFAAMPGLAPRRSPTAGGEAERIIVAGLPARQLPACASCHASGVLRAAPRLDGQRATYLVGRLERWRAGEETIDARRPQDVMAVIARRIPDDMVAPLAKAYAARD